MDEVRLTEEEIDTLHAETKEWATKTNTDKKAIRERLAQDFLAAREEPVNKWSKTCMKTKISMWISNHVTSKTAHRVPKLLKTTWSGRDVFYEQKSADIQKCIDELKGEGYVHIAAVNKARAEHWELLGEEEQQAYEDTARCGHRKNYCQTGARLGVRLLWDQADVMTYVSYAWRDSEGKLKHAWYDISMAWHDDKPEVVRFTDHQPNWNKEFPQFFKTYTDWMLSNADEDTRAHELPSKPKGGPAEMELDTRGLPLLPSLDSVSGQPARQATIQKLFNEHYSTCVRNQGHACPVAYFLAAIIPDELVIQDPSKMGKKAIEDLWEHILTLQECEDPVDQFQFSHYLHGSEWQPAKYDIDITPRKKSGRKRPKTAHGPPGLPQLPADEEGQADDEEDEMEDNEGLGGHGRGVGAKSKALEDHIRGVDPVVPPLARLLKGASNQPPTWVEHDPERVFTFLWALSPEQAWQELLTSWKHMVAIPERIHSNASTWANLIEWIEENGPVENTAWQELQRWFLAAGMIMRDTRCANDVEPDETEPVPYGGPEYMQWSIANLGLIKDRVLPAIERAHCLSSNDIIGQTDLDPHLNAIPQPGPSALGLASKLHVPPVAERTSRAQNVSGQNVPTKGSVMPERTAAGIPSARGRRGQPPGIPAQQLEPGNISGQEVIENRAQPSLNSDKALTLAPSQRHWPPNGVLNGSSSPTSSCHPVQVAKHTHGREQAKQTEAQVPEDEVPGTAVLADQVPGPSNDVIMEILSPGLHAPWHRLNIHVCIM
ncbi:hypothetical protein LXA43DRAFT_1062872 [Ganoderma leucocontextum]|nr:hypothetical protein LXA43DRAFT_1062872 [Ganoderma leucocontextum]